VDMADFDTFFYKFSLLAHDVYSFDVSMRIQLSSLVFKMSTGSSLYSKGTNLYFWDFEASTYLSMVYGMAET
jgi:hypothetical protein